MNSSSKMLLNTENSPFQKGKTMFLPKSHLVSVMKKCEFCVFRETTQTNYLKNALIYNGWSVFH